MDLLVNEVARRKTFAADIQTVFGPDRFSRRRLPIHVGSLKGVAEFSDYPACLDMLIAVPGGIPALPEPYAGDPAINAFLDAAIAHENEILPGWSQTRYLYLTVDRRYVRAGDTHRNAGWHFDGMQGARYPEKLPICHQYVVADRLMTEFSDRPTSAIGLDELRHNWFEALAAQIPETDEPWRAAPMEIVAMSAYQLHRSPVAMEDGWRTFIRLDVSCKKVDRVGNTINPDLPAPFTFHERSLPDGLEREIRDTAWDNGARQFSQS